MKTTLTIGIFLAALIVIPFSAHAQGVVEKGGSCATALCKYPLVCSTDTKICQEFGPQPSASSNNLFGLGQTIINIINNVLIPLLFAIAFLVFIFGVYKYFIYGGADSKSHEEGRKLILYGIIGFAVMVSVWGLVNIVTGSFGLGTGGAPKYPTL